MQDAIDAKPHGTRVAARLKMNVAGTLLEGVLPEPVHNRDDMPVVGIEAATALPQLHQLLEVAGRPGASAALRIAHRLGQAEEFDDVARNVLRISHHPPHLTAQQPRELIDPVGHHRLGRGHHHFMVTYRHRQDAMTARILTRHDFCNACEVHFQRIDTQIWQTAALRKPLGQPFKRQRLTGGGGSQGPLRERHQWVQGPRCKRCLLRNALAFIARNQPVFDQCGQ